MNAISPAPVNLDLYFHKMHKLDKDSESKRSVQGGGNVWQRHNYMPVEEMAPKWRQFDKLEQLEVCISINLLVLWGARPRTESSASATMFNISETHLINIYLQNSLIVGDHLHA